jgi:hypothetical protein
MFIAAFRKRDSLVRRLAHARRTGAGLYLREWFIAADAATMNLGEAMVEQVIEWCRATIAECRRPWGIDHFELALAYATVDGQICESARFKRLRPMDLYREEGLARRLASFIPATGAGTHPSALPAIHLAAALFSWGDAAHAALPAQI